MTRTPIVYSASAAAASTVSLTNAQTASNPRASETVSALSFVSKYLISSPVPSVYRSNPGLSYGFASKNASFMLHTLRKS